MAFLIKPARRLLHPVLRWFGFSIEIRGAERTMLRMVKDGETYRAIAKHYGASPTLLYDWRRRNPDRRHKFDAARHRASARGRLEDAVEAYGGFGALLDDLRDGVCAVEIVKRLGTTLGSFYRWLHDDPSRWHRWRATIVARRTAPR